MNLLFWIGIFWILLGIGIWVYGTIKFRKTKEFNEILTDRNQELEKDIDGLLNQRSDLIAENSSLTCEINKQKQNKLDLQNSITILSAHQDALKENIIGLEASQKTTKKILDEGLAAYSDVLDKTYNEKEQEYEELLQILYNSYERQQEQLINNLTSTKEEYLKDIDEIKNVLNKLRATRVAAMEAALKEQEIKEQRAFYSLPMSDAELADIKTLEAIKTKLLKPRILSMLIWQSYYQKSMTALCNKVLGASTVKGIYKITNQTNGMCYIGQSVDIATRWKDHAKCGLGIDTPVGNKLYKAMLEDGIWNFTWELLEKCESIELNEKEAFYIELYDSCNFGYNSTKGNK